MTAKVASLNPQWPLAVASVTIGPAVATCWSRISQRMPRPSGVSSPQCGRNGDASFPPQFFFENRIMRADHFLLITVLNRGELWYVPPVDGAPPVEPVLIAELVDIKGEDFWMHTSLTRDDTGAGACEVLYVQSIKRRYH